MATVTLEDLIGADTIIYPNDEEKVVAEQTSLFKPGVSQHDKSASFSDYHNETASVVLKDNQNQYN